MQMEDTDKLPKGKNPCLSLRELEKQVNTDLDLLVNIVDGQMTVCELVDRYLKTKTGVRQSTKQGYCICHNTHLYGECLRRKHLAKRRYEV